MSPYVAIDGVDGCGKSTQAALLVAWLRARGLPVRHVREPGSTPVAEHLRQLLLDPATGDLDADTEALLFSAARRELLRREIEPALAAGTAVVSERCFASTWVYQCVAAAAPADREAVAAATRAVHAHCRPDLLVVLDVPAAVAAERLGQHRDRIEARDRDYHARVGAGFRALAEPAGFVARFLGPGAVAVVDAGDGNSETVHQRVCAAVVERLAVLGGPA